MNAGSASIEHAMCAIGMATGDEQASEFGQAWGNSGIWRAIGFTCGRLSRMMRP